MPELTSSCFFFNDPATTEIYTLSLHDALPILCGSRPSDLKLFHRRGRLIKRAGAGSEAALRSRWRRALDQPTRARSEEHTSELQSQSNLVCRLLLEKKKKQDLPQPGVTIKSTA